MNLKISYQELKTFLNKILKGTVNVEKIEYVKENTISAQVKKSILSVNAELSVVEFWGHDIVVDLQLGGLLGGARWGQKFLTKEKGDESRLEQILRKANMEGLVSIDETNRNRMTIHLDKIDALTSVLELLELKGLAFDNSDARLSVETV